MYCLDYYLNFYKCTYLGYIYWLKFGKFTLICQIHPFVQLFYKRSGPDGTPFHPHTSIEVKPCNSLNGIVHLKSSDLQKRTYEDLQKPLRSRHNTQIIPVVIYMRWNILLLFRCMCSAWLTLLL